MKKSKKRFKTAQEALLGVASMPVQVIDQPADNRTGLRKFMDAEAAEQQRVKDEETRKTKELQDQISENLRKVRDAESAPIQAYWQQDLAAISAFGITKAPVDKWLCVETTATRGSEAAIFETYKKFRSDIEARGVSLSEDSWSKLGSYLQAARFHSQASLTAPGTFQAALIRLYTLKCLDVTGDPLTLLQAPESQPQTQADPQPTLDETLRTVSGETREGRAELLAAVHDSIANEALDVYHLWYRSVIDGFGCYLTPEDVKVITNRMVKLALPFRAPASWNSARVWACQNGLLSNNNLLTADERACIAIENDPRPTSDYQARVDTAKMIGKLVQA
jgi:hypothetical protein